MTSDWAESSIWPPGGSSLLSLPYKVPSGHCSHSGSHFQGCSLKRARCIWDHLEWIHDWTQVRPLCKCLIFWQVGEELYSSYGLWRQALYVSSLVCYNYHLPILSGLPHSLVYSCFSHSGVSFTLYPGSFQVFKQSAFPRVLQEKGSGSCQSLMSWAQNIMPHSLCEIVMEPTYFWREGA